MYANQPFAKKLSLFWGIIPVYFVIFEVTYTINHYIIFSEQYSGNLLKIISVQAVFAIFYHQ